MLKFLGHLRSLCHASQFSQTFIATLRPIKTPTVLQMGVMEDADRLRLRLLIQETMAMIIISKVLSFQLHRLLRHTSQEVTVDHTSQEVPVDRTSQEVPEECTFQEALQLPYNLVPSVLQ